MKNQRVILCLTRKCVEVILHELAGSPFQFATPSSSIFQLVILPLFLCKTLFPFHLLKHNRGVCSSLTSQSASPFSAPTKSLSTNRGTGNLGINLIDIQLPVPDSSVPNFLVIFVGIENH